MDVEGILEARKAKYKTTDVSKEVELQYDVGMLLATDLNPLDPAAIRDHKEEYLKELTRDNTQLLLNKLWELPTETSDEGYILAQLPASSTVLPREKPIPKPKQLTKWDEFALTKGISKKKRQRMIFDETTQEWKPRWGYKRKDDPKDDWVLEVPENADPYEDQFEKRDKKKKEDIAKNEYQRLRNIGKSLKGGRVKVPLPPAHTKELKKHEVTQALGMAKKATASVGKFTPALEKETAPKREKKRQFAPVVGDSAVEKQRNLDILGKLAVKKPVLNVTKAVNTHIAAEESNNRKRKAPMAGHGRNPKRSKMGGKANFGSKSRNFKTKTKTLGGSSKSRRKK